MTAHYARPPQRRLGRGWLRPGLTLLELTLVILVMLLLVTILFVGANSWKNGTDRARCVMNIRQMQMSVRAYSVARGADPGTDLGLEVPPVSVLADLVGPGKFVPELPTCPANGLYFFGDDVIPEIGTLYMTCSLASSREHVPKRFGGW